MIAVPAKAATRIYPQMSQMSTDEEKHLCLDVFICEYLWTRFPSQGLAGTMIKARVEPVEPLAQIFILYPKIGEYHRGGNQ